MESRKPIDALAMSLMTTLCLIWGFQQVAMKATVAEMAPVLQIALRSGIAAVMVGLLMALRGERLTLRGGPWRPGLLVGFLFAFEFLLVGLGLRLTSASHMVVLVYTAPIFAALGLHRLLPTERLVALQWAGIALAFSGILLAFFGGGHAPSSAGSGGLDMLWGDLLGLAAGAAWGATTVAVRTTRLSSLPASQTLLYQLVGAFVLLSGAALALGQTGFRNTPLAWGNLLFQALVVSFASFLAWFWLLRNYMASQLGVFSFLTPLFGVGFGVWLLGEPLEPGFVAGAALVLVGIVLVSGHAWIGPLVRRAVGLRTAKPAA